MTRVPTIDYGAGALPTASSLGAADCRTGGSKAGLTTQPREATDPLRTSLAAASEDAGRSATGQNHGRVDTKAKAGNLVRAGRSDPCADAPAAWFWLELPKPPSVNRFTAKLGNKSPGVVKWIKECDGRLMARRRVERRPWPRFKGPFELCIWWDINQFGRFDCDNRVKPLLDWLQRVEIIENDRWCRHLHVMWGPTSLGCRVAVRSWEAA